VTTTGPGGTTSYTRDALGSLRSVELGDGRLVEYVVDALGRRVGKRVDGVLVKQWLYRNSLKPAAELDGAGALVARYVYGSKFNVPDYVIRGTQTYRVVSDQLGSPVLAVNVADVSDVPFRASYEAFGKVTGTGLDWMPFGFAGGIHDAETGLVRFGARDYEPETGRWVSKDPARWNGGQTNLYAYASADPMNLSDANGANVCVYRSSQRYHHAWIEIGGDPASSYGFWPGDDPFGGRGIVNNPDPRAQERSSPQTDVICSYSTMNEDDELERWINVTYDVSQLSDRWPYFLGIHDCRGFASDVIHQLLRMQADPWQLGHDFFWTSW
jgi:RHS repeat-associated protein